MKVLVFGSCNLDYIYKVPKIVSPGETLPIRKVAVSPGGKGLNQAVALKKAGLDVAFAGNIGPDGGMLRALLDKAGVDVSLLRAADDANGQAHIQVTDTGENAILLYPGANCRATRAQIDDAIARFDPGDVLVLQNEVNELSYLIDRAFERGLRTALNPSPFAPELLQTDLDKIWLMFVNETEAAGFANGRALADFIADTRKTHPALRCVVTLGAAGSVYFDKDAVLRQAAFPADPVDTTCAGDTFTGYFTETLLRTGDPAAALRRASAASSVVISRIGAAGMIPSAEEVDRVLAAAE